VALKEVPPQQVSVGGQSANRDHAESEAHPEERVRVEADQLEGVFRR
jgi:hypothetical protein